MTVIAISFRISPEERYKNLTPFAFLLLARLLRLSSTTALFTSSVRSMAHAMNVGWIFHDLPSESIEPLSPLVSSCRYIFVHTNYLTKSCSNQRNFSRHANSMLLRFFVIRAQLLLVRNNSHCWKRNSPYTILLTMYAPL